MAALGEVPVLLPDEVSSFNLNSCSIPNISIIKFLSISSVSSHIFSFSSS